MKKFFKRIVWKVERIFGLAEERKITVKSFLYRYPIFSEYRVFMEVYDPDEEQYTDSDEIFNSATATKEESEKLMKESSTNLDGYYDSTSDLSCLARSSTIFFHKSES